MLYTVISKAFPALPTYGPGLDAVIIPFQLLPLHVLLFELTFTHIHTASVFVRCQEVATEEREAAAAGMEARMEASSTSTGVAATSTGSSGFAAACSSLEPAAAGSALALTPGPAAGEGVTTSTASVTRDGSSAERGDRGERPGGLDDGGGGGGTALSETRGPSDVEVGQRFFFRWRDDGICFSSCLRAWVFPAT